MIRPSGHLEMVAAVQPFLSGGVSKTLNLPNDATPDDIWNTYVEAWQKGLKCIAIFRDGCKASQPLTVQGEAKSEDVEKVSRPRRKKLPQKREGGNTTEVNINGLKLFITANPFEDGTLGEVFVEVENGGQTITGLLKTAAILTSMSLQYGTPLEALASKFINNDSLEFEPKGATTHEVFQRCSSPVELMFRHLMLEFGESGKKVLPAVEEPKPESVEKKDELVENVIFSHKGCPKCGSHLLEKSGTCEVCRNCGSTTGCS